MLNLLYTTTSKAGKLSHKIHEMQGYAIVLDKIAFITRVFEAEGGEGFQFNVRFTSELRLAPRFATRNEAELGRELLISALKNS